MTVIWLYHNGARDNRKQVGGSTKITGFFLATGTGQSISTMWKLLSFLHCLLNASGHTWPKIPNCLCCLFVVSYLRRHVIEQFPCYSSLFNIFCLSFLQRTAIHTFEPFHHRAIKLSFNQTFCPRLYRNTHWRAFFYSLLKVHSSAKISIGSYLSIPVFFAVRDTNISHGVFMSTRHWKHWI